MESLLLFRRALSSPTMCRFIPALSVTWFVTALSVTRFETAADFYESWIARHPRRSCEVMWKQLMECRFVGKNPIPRNATWSELRAWFKPLLAAE